jgi:hypothetical protein
LEYAISRLAERHQFIHLAGHAARGRADLLLHIALAPVLAQQAESTHEGAFFQK